MSAGADRARYPDRASADSVPVSSAVVAIVDTTGPSVLLIRRQTTDREFPGQWCFPGGEARPGETGPDAATREALEETGLTVSGLAHLGRRLSFGATGRPYLIDCYLTDTWSGSLVDFPTPEHAAAEWVPVESLPSFGPSGPATRWLALKVWARSTERAPRSSTTL